jgi:hypothetical protein
MRSQMTRWNALKCVAVLVVAMSLGVLAQPVASQGRVFIGEGSGIDTGRGQLAIGCASLTVAGLASGQWSGIGDIELASSARLETSRLEFGGDWHGTGVHDVPGEVAWQQQCDRLDGSMRGSTRFAALSVTTTSGLLRRFDVSGEQIVTGTLRLAGGEMPLVLRSTVPGEAAPLTVPASASWSIQGVDVADIDSSAGQALAPGDPANWQSRDSGGNRNWFLGALALPVPLFGAPGLLLLALALFVLGRRRLALTSIVSTTMRNSDHD